MWNFLIEITMGGHYSVIINNLRGIFQSTIQKFV